MVDALLDVMSLNYSETLMAASGFQAEKCLSDTIKNNKGKYIVLVEGAVPTGADGVYCMIGGKTAESILQTVAKDAAAVVSVGQLRLERLRTGGQAEPDRGHADLQTGGQAGDQRAWVPAHCGRDDERGDAPAGAGEAAGTGQPGTGPRSFMDGASTTRATGGRTTTQACLWSRGTTRTRARGIASIRWGCRGPVTYNACSVTKWNEGTSYPIQSGHGCIGCSEAGVLGQTARFISICHRSQGSGIESTADTIGTVVGVATLAGVAAHAVITNVRKHPVIAEVHTEDQKEQ